MSSHRHIARLSVRNSLWVAVGNFAAQFISFATVILLTRLLPQEAFGVLAYGIFWQSLLFLNSKFALNTAAIQTGAVTGALMGTYAGLQIGLSLLSLGLCFGVYAISPVFAGNPEAGLVLIVLASATAFSSLTAPLSIALEIEYQFSRITFASMGVSIGAGLVAIALAYAGWGLWSLLIQSVVTTVAMMAVTVFVAVRRIPHVFRLPWRFDRVLALSLVRRGLPLGVADVGILTIVNQFDTYLVFNYAGAAVTGLYDRAYRISQWPNVLITAALTRVSLVTFARMKSDAVRLAYTAEIGVWVLCWLGVPVSLWVSLAAPAVVQVLYGERWAGAEFFLRFLALYTAISPFTALASTQATAMADTKQVFRLVIVQAMSMLIMGTLLTTYFGVNGTLAAVGITTCLGAALALIYLSRFLGYILIRLLLQTFAAGVAGAATFLLVNRLLEQWDVNALGHVLVTGPVFAGVFWLTLFAFSPRQTLVRLGYLRARFTGQAEAETTVQPSETPAP